MNFHETIMGKRFFESQLPTLITALQGIAEKMTAPAAAIQLPTKADPNFLRELYTQSKAFDTTEESRKYTRTVVETQSKFFPHLSDGDREAFNAYQEAVERRDEEFAERAYRIGFQTAVQMIMTGLSASREETAND